MAFIDGMHLFEYALRDLINIERHCSPGSVLLVHDCYPQDEVTAARERSTRRWSGDIWKLVLCLREYRPELRLATLDVAPTGLAVITGVDSGSRVLAERYDEICERYVPLAYGVLDAGKPEALAGFRETPARSPSSCPRGPSGRTAGGRSRRARAFAG